METISSCSSSIVDCSRDIELLEEAFGSTFSLEEITSAYVGASRNVDQAGAFLCDLRGQTVLKAHKSKDKQAFSDDASQLSLATNGNLASLKPSPIAKLKLSASQSSSSVTCKLGSKEPVTMSSMNRMKQDMEDFLFKMLGDGFQLDKNKIHEVLGMCGYDLEKSMETLVDLSASSLWNSDDVVNTTAERNYLNGSCLCPEMSEPLDSSLSSANQNGKTSLKKNKNKLELQREILSALFTGPERAQELPKRTISKGEVVRSSAFGRPVVEPLKDTKIEETFVELKLLNVSEKDEDDQNNMISLRHAVQEYWGLMKEYYKAAAEAYAKGDHARASKLMQEGQFYKSKAQEADEKSTQKLLKKRSSEDEVLLNMSPFQPKEAVEILRRNLLIFAGLPDTRFLKLMVGNDDARRKRKGRKQVVCEELKKESIEWTEIDNGETIVIQIDEIDPKNLSFAEK